MRHPVFLALWLACLVPLTAAARDPIAATRSEPGPWGSGWEPADVEIADLDDDGNSDLVVIYGFTGVLSICYGDGEGGFGRAARIPLDAGIRSVAVGRAGPERSPFLAVLNGRTRALSFHVRQATGAWRRPWRDVTIGEEPVSVAIGYRDQAGGRPFVVTANPGSHDLTICDWVEGGGFEVTSAETIPAIRKPSKPRRVIAADLDGDGSMDDLAVVDARSSAVSVLLRGDGGGWDRPYHPFETLDTPLDAALFDHGAWDEPVLAVANSGYPNVTLNVRVDDARFGWAAVDSIPVAGFPFAVDVTEVGELRLPVLAVAARAEGKVYAFLLDPQGGREFVGVFETGDDGLRALEIGCLRGTDRPFIIAAGRRLHAFPLFWEPEKSGGDSPVAPADSNRPTR